ncbi:MAG: hypothetical protein ACK4WH_07725 [Phycisphaerales bacterium]
MKRLLGALVVVFVLVCYPVLAIIGFTVATACLYQLGSSETWGGVVRISPGFSNCYFDFIGDPNAIPSNKSLIFHVTWHAKDYPFIYLSTLDDKIEDILTFDRRYRGADYGLALRLALTIYTCFLIVESLLLVVGCVLGDYLCRILLRPSYWTGVCSQTYRRGVYCRAACYSAVLAAPATIVFGAALLMLSPFEHYQQYSCLPGLTAPSWYGMAVLLAVPGVLVSLVMLRVHRRRVGGAVSLADARCVCDYPCAPGRRCPECGRINPDFPPVLRWSWRVRPGGNS